jgi:hypothetical protein
MISAESIQAFFTAASRGENDAKNAVRESVLEMILTPAAADFCMEAEQWFTIRSGWRDALGLVEDQEVSIKKMAGRKHNYDFAVSSDGRTQKVEFKCGAGVSSLADLPQILSLSGNFDLLLSGTDVPLYAEHFYKVWLPIYLEADADSTAGSDEELRSSLPELDKYMKLVHQSNYDRHPFFRRLYDREEVNKAEKAAIVDQSISSYLLLAAGELDLDKLTTKLVESQSGKRFVMWDSRAHKFNHAEISEDDLRLVEMVEITKNSIVVAAASGQRYKMLLRWKNHKGILLPAWQISFL